MLSIIVCLFISGLVYMLGQQATKIMPSICRFNLPVAVIGSFLTLPFLSVAEKFCGQEIHIPSGLRDFLLIVFFCSMGLAVRFRQAFSAGWALIVLSILSFILILLQNLTGVLIVLLFDLHPAYGLLSGSISYVGGFGSSLAWGSYYQQSGLPYALEVGFSSATFGLISGSLLAGPVAGWLAGKNSKTLVSSSQISEVDKIFESQQSNCFRQFLSNLCSAPTDIIKTVILLAVSVATGKYFSLSFFELHIPEFLLSMICGALLANFALIFDFKLSEKSLGIISELSFNCFIALSLLGMRVSAISEFMLVLLIVMLAQIVLVVLFTIFVVYRVMGRNYDSAVLSAGVIGYALSSMAVAVATVRTMIANYGPSPTSLMLISLAGAALVDVPNNLLIAILSRMDFFSY